ncbi:MAG: DUF1743 domain-containing protein [Candidatus Bathyarchaeia archaeon]
MVNLHIGFDDTDSPRGGCTTYVAALLVEKLERSGVVFIDYPNLIRLNPNVPWKTRGNAALCLRITCSEDVVDAVFEIVAESVERNSDLGFEGTDPGIVFFQGNRIPSEIQAFAKKTIQDVVRMEDALKLIRKFKAEALGFETGYGIIGGLAAIGESLEDDHTYEVIAYRNPENRGTPRQVNYESIKRMDQETKPKTFNNIDSETGRILITPRGPDPILYGIRGETADAVIEAHKMVQVLEPVERWVVFRTNQGTDAHLKKINTINDIRPYHPIIATGIVASKPKLVPRRHRIFAIRDETSTVDCAAYEPTGTLRKVARQLIPGDSVEVAGGVKASSSKRPTTINLEKLRVVKLAPKLELRNPKCSRCGKRMDSMGKGKGFRCGKCGLRNSNLQKIFVEEKRRICEGLFVTSPRSQRHLTKPLSRYGKEKSGIPENMVSCWHQP